MMWDPGAGATRPTTKSETRQRLALMVLATIVAMASHTSSLDTDPSYFAYVFCRRSTELTTHGTIPILFPRTLYAVCCSLHPTSSKRVRVTFLFSFGFIGAAGHVNPNSTSAAGLLSGVAVHDIVIDSDTDTEIFIGKVPDSSRATFVALRRCRTITAVRPKYVTLPPRTRSVDVCLTSCALYPISVHLCAGPRTSGDARSPRRLGYVF